MNKTLKTFISISLIIVLIIVAACGYALARVGGLFYDRPECYIAQFYKEPENSLDGAVVGSSAAYRYWIGTEAFNRTGMAVYCYGSASTPIYVHKNIIEEVVKTQSPKFIAIEIRSLVKSIDVFETRHALNIINYMPPSVARLQIIKEFFSLDLKYDTRISKNIFHYDFPERRGKSESAKQSVINKSKYKGFSEYDNTPPTTFAAPEYTDAKAPLDYDYAEALVELLDYCDTLDCEVVFFATPWVITESKQMKINYAIDIIENRGYDVIDMNKKEVIAECGLDFSNDFHNNKHVNNRGAVKVTDYLADKFKERYDIKDHRGDKLYDSWSIPTEQLLE